MSSVWWSRTHGLLFLDILHVVHILQNFQIESKATWGKWPNMWVIWVFQVGEANDKYNGCPFHHCCCSWTLHIQWLRRFTYLTSIKINKGLWAIGECYGLQQNHIPYDFLISHLKKFSYLCWWGWVVANEKTQTSFTTMQLTCLEETYKQNKLTATVYNPNNACHVHFLESTLISNPHTNFLVEN